MTFDEWFMSVDVYEQVHALKGIPQPEKWHPEGDAYVHTKMVCREAWDRYFFNGVAYKPLIMFAAMTHDFGKALTNPAKWPSHYGHADLGVAPTRAYLREIYGTDECNINICTFTTKYHMHMHQIFDMKPATLVKIFKAAVEMCGVNYYMIALETLAQLGVCDHYGRGNVDHSVPYYDTLRFLAFMYHIDSIYKGWKHFPKELEQHLKNITSWNFYRDYDLNGAKPNRYPVYLERANSVLGLRKD